MARRKRLVWDKATLLEKLYPLLYLQVVAGYPFVAGLGIIGRIPGSIPGLAYRGYVILLSVLMLYLASGRKGRFLLTGGQALLGIVWGIMFVRLTIDTVFFPIPLFDDPARLWLFAIGVSCLPLWPMFILPEESWLERTFRWVYNAAYIAIPLATVGAIMEPKTAYVFRLGGERISSITLGHLGASLALMSGWCIATNYRKNQPTIKIFAGLFLGILDVALAASRGPFLVLALGFFILVITSVKPARRMPKITVYGIGTFLALVPGVLVFLSTFTSFDLLSRLANSGESDSSGGEYTRGNIIPKSIEFFWQSPIFGAGTNVPEFAIYPHNWLVESFMATGIVGGTIMVVLVGNQIRCAWWLLKNKSPHGWIGLISFQIVLMMSTSYSIFLEGSFWAMIALTYTIYIFEKRKLPQQSAPAVMSPAVA